MKIDQISTGAQVAPLPTLRDCSASVAGENGCQAIRWILAHVV